MPNRRCTSGLHFTRAWVVKPFVRFLEGQGYPSERGLLEVHLSPDLLEDDDAIVPIRPAIAFIERASRAEGIDHLGLRVAETVTVDELGSMQSLMVRSRNLNEYLESACRLAGSITTSARYAVCVSGDTAHFHYGTLDVGNPVHGHLFTLDVTINTLRALAGESWSPAELVLPAGTAEGLAAISSAFEDARVDRSARSASFAFPRSFLALPAPRPSETSDVPLDADLARPDAGGFRDAVRRLVECLILEGFADVHTAADAAGMSVRTFQRRLAECGLVFTRLVQEARIEVAQRWLREEGRPVNEIANALGYTDAANFTRAFRRLNGLSPSAFKASLEGEVRAP